MRYTINLESSYRTHNFRLSQNKYWISCDNVTKLNNSDYFTPLQSTIIGLQERNIVLTIDNKKFEVHPEMGTELGNENQLHYEIYGFRQMYPTPPNENQLMNLLLAGNDDVRNILILKTDGIFYLVQQHQILDYASNPEYVVQFEGFQPGNRYVGNSINNNNIRNYVQNLFRIAVFHWINHLKLKILHDHADIQIQSHDQVPEILSMFDELYQIEINWKPDY